MINMMHMRANTHVYTHTLRGGGGNMHYILDAN